VTGNRIGNSQDSATQSCEIVESSNSSANLIYGNDLSGKAVGALGAGGEDAVVRGNVGDNDEWARSPYKLLRQNLRQFVTTQVDAPESSQNRWFFGTLKKR